MSDVGILTHCHYRDRARMQWLARASKRVARKYGGTFNSDINIETMEAEYRTRVPQASVLRMYASVKRARFIRSQKSA